jgi:hypothetical protein
MKNKIKLLEGGRRHSSKRVMNVNGCINRLLIFKNKKGGYKVLKRPICYSGIFSCLLVLLMFTFMSVGCEKPNDWIPSNGDNNDTNTTETIEFSEYSLTQCHWNRSNLIQDSVYIINSQEEFLTFISCEGENIPVPAIDFNQYTLVIVHGSVTYGIEQIAKTLQQISITEYQLDIDITLDFTAMAPGWEVALLIPKLPQGIIITLNKVEHH